MLGARFSAPLLLSMFGSPLNLEEIASLVAGNPPLVQDYISLDAQLQPAGFDLSLREVARFTGSGQLGASNDSRRLSDTELVSMDADGWISLQPGPFLVTFNEIVNLPPDIMALGRPRSSLLRSGVSLHTAVWDPSYCGRSQSLLSVRNPAGFRLQRDARLAQLVFFRLSNPPEQGYRGRYQGEGL